MVDRTALAPETFHHVILRGTRGMTIMPTDADYWDCVRLLYYVNDVYRNSNWKREVARETKFFARPANWPPRDPLVLILAYCLHDTHLHLLVKEIREGGLTAFMRRLPNSMSLRFNKVHGGSGSIFQGSYLSRHITNDADLRTVALYIMVKNVLERYPKGGLQGAQQSLAEALVWAEADKFSSFPDYAAGRASPIVAKDVLADFFPTPASFRKQAEEYMHWRGEREEATRDLLLEDS